MRAITAIWEPLQLASEELAEIESVQAIRIASPMDLAK